MSELATLWRVSGVEGELEGENLEELWEMK